MSASGTFKIRLRKLPAVCEDKQPQQPQQQPLTDPSLNISSSKIIQPSYERPNVNFMAPPRDFSYNWQENCSLNNYNNMSCDNVTSSSDVLFSAPYTLNSGMLFPRFRAENSDLLKKFTKPHLEVVIDSDEDDNGKETSSQPTVIEETSAIKEDESNAKNRVIKMASADESVVEVSIDRFEPRMVGAINFEVLKLPSSSQKNPSAVDSEASNEKPAKVASSMKKPSTKKPESAPKLKPRSLEPQMAAAKQQQSTPASLSLSTSNTTKGTTKSTAAKLESSSTRTRSVQKELKTPKSSSQSDTNKNKARSESESSRKVDKNTDASKQASKARVNYKIEKIKNRSYQILNELGKGGSSVVYHIFDLQENKSKALKVVNLKNSEKEVVEGFKNEIKLLQQLRHCKRVVRLYDFEFRKDTAELYIIMEKGDDDLGNVLKSHLLDTNRKGKLNSSQVKFYWQEMLCVVNELHAHNVVHSDLKPVNFILVSGKLKLIDFGIAKAIQSNKTSVVNECIIGTFDYMPPESLKRKCDASGKSVVKYNLKADIWSLGVILYNMVFNRTPFQHLKDAYMKFLAISNPDTQIEYPDKESVDPLLLDIIQKCLQRDPSKRPTTDELLQHKYLSELPKHQTKPSTPRNADGDPNSGIKNDILSKIKDMTPNSLLKLSKVIESQASKKA